MGTHCSGTVAALGGNNEGVVGVIPNNAGEKFQLIIVNALTNAGSGSTSGVMKAVDICIENGAQVVSLSLGGGSQSSIVENFYKEKYDNGILFIAAAGNGGCSRESYLYPAAYPSLVSVAAVDSNENRASFSQCNDQVEISGPGVAVESTLPGDRYASWSGTSMATPHVAGVAGLLWMHFPQCKNYQIRNVLLATAKDRGSSGCDNYYGTGLVQAKDAYDLLSEGNCGGHLGYTDASKGGCAQLNPSAPSFAPVTSPTSAPVSSSGTASPSVMENTFAPTTTETIVFPPTSTEEPIEDSFAPTASESVVFPPTSTESPVTSGPTRSPLAGRTPYPTGVRPTPFPTDSVPTPHPTNAPPTPFPTAIPNTPWPTASPPTPHPTDRAPTPFPTDRAPTSYPTASPTASPTPLPTSSPTPLPTTAPTVPPPTLFPTETPPTPHPTNTPPTLHPTVTPPTPHPTNVPPTPHPTEAPPTPYPTGAPPTPFPTSGAESDQGATESPTEGPTNAPTE